MVLVKQQVVLLNANLNELFARISAARKRITAM